MTLKQFDVWIRNIFERSYPHLRLMRVVEGCICISWLTANTEEVICDVERAHFVHELCDDVISISMGGEVLFDTQGYVDKENNPHQTLPVVDPDEGYHSTASILKSALGKGVRMEPIDVFQ